MQFLLLIWLAILCWLPHRSHELLGAVYATERLHIAVDNFAIRLGQADRQLWNTVEKTKKVVWALEKAHHLVHGCAQLKVPKCMAADVPIEKALQVHVRSLHQFARAAWALGPVRARGALIGEALCGLRREARAPIFFDPCPVCGLPTRIRIASDKLRSSATTCLKNGSQAEVSLQLEAENGRWQYVLKAGE